MKNHRLFMSLRIRIFLVALVLLGGFPGQAFCAQPDPPAEADTLSETVKLAAQVDAYNAFCQKDTAMGEGIIKRFVPEENKKQIEKLEDLRDTSFKAAKTRLDEKKMECSSSDYLMEKFSIMQQLKILFAQILGVDPTKQKLDGSPLPPPPKDLIEQQKEMVEKTKEKEGDQP